MSPKKSSLDKPVLQKIFRNRMPAVIGVALLVLVLAAMASGCGDSNAGSSTAADLAPVGLSRPAPGTVELLDGKNDVTGSQNISQVPSWLDINWVSVAQDSGSLIFTMDVADSLPTGMQANMAAEWGFMLDTEKDGTPDWIVYASNTVQDGWTVGVFNPKTKERLSGPQFPGTASHADTKVILTVKASALGTPSSFKWFAFSNVYIKPASGEGQQAGDKAPDNGAPDNSADWLPYP